MAILSGYERQTKTVADANGDHKKISRWTHADTVELPNGLSLAESEVYLTQAEYDALSDEEKKNGKKYYITDGKTSSKSIAYDNSISGLDSTDMQGAIDEVNENKVEKFYETLEEVDLDTLVTPMQTICVWCGNVPKNDESGSRGRLEIAVDYDGTVHQRYSLFTLNGTERFSGIYERYKCADVNYDTSNEWSDWVKVGAPLTTSLTETSMGLALDATQGKVLNDKIAKNETAINTINGDLTPITRSHRCKRKQLSSTEIAALKIAITNGNFEGIDIIDGDYFYGASGYLYTVAHYNYFKGSVTQYSVISANHYAIVVDAMSTTPWLASGTPTTAYKGSTLRDYLINTVLPNVISDMNTLGFNVLSRSCLESNSLNATGYNRWGTATGCSNSWEWVIEQIIALSEPQVYGTSIVGSSFFDVGDGNRWLNCFKNFSFMDIANMKYFWLRELSSASCACDAAGNHGHARGANGLAHAFFAFGLIAIN